MPRTPHEHSIVFKMPLTEFSALNKLLVHLLCPVGRLDTPAILQAADGDREMYSEMLCALLHVQTASHRLKNASADGAFASLLFDAGARPSSRPIDDGAQPSVIRHQARQP